jgi:hypothetical protein
MINMNDPELTPTLDPNSPTGIYIPADLDDCFRELDNMLPAVRIAGIRECEEVYLVLHHFGLSAWMRNNWGLWLQPSRLKRYFDGLGVFQADSASSIILAAYWHYLNGRPVDLQRLIVYDKMMREKIQAGTDTNSN